MGDVDVQKLRAAIKRDLELIQELECELARLARRIDHYQALVEVARLAEGGAR